MWDLISKIADVVKAIAKIFQPSETTKPKASDDTGFKKPEPRTK